MDNPEQFNNRKQRYLRYRIRKKLTVAAQQQQQQQQLRRGDSSSGIVAQLAERGFAYNRQQNEIDSENESPRWDLNPRPKVSAFHTVVRAEDYETFA